MEVMEACGRGESTNTAPAAAAVQAATTRPPTGKVMSVLTKMKHYDTKCWYYVYGNKVYGQ